MALWRRLRESAGLRTALALATLLAGVAPALVPLTRPGLPGTNDAQGHLYRLVALQQVFAAEGWGSRWLPEVAYGYGMPVFDFYGPLAYVPGLLAMLLGLGYVTALKVAYGFPLILSSVTMFALVRSLFGEVPAVVAGLVYAYLPYQMFDLYVRGALAESAAFIWLPLVAWSLVEQRTDGRARWTVGAALGTGFLVTTHNVTALFALPALAGLATILWWPTLDGGAREWRYPLRAALSLGLGLGLGAWYWLPALAEKGLVQADLALTPTGSLSTYFIQRWPPFQMSLAHEYRGFASTDSAETKIGVVQVAVALAGTSGLLRSRGPTHRALMWAAALVVLAMSLQFRVAAPFFEAVPLFPYIQFPWRLLSLVGLGTGVLAGAFIHRFPTRFGARILAAGVVVLLSGYSALAGLAPEQVYVDDRYLTAEGIIRHEQADFGLGTTIFGEFMPTTVPLHGTDAIRRAMLGPDDRAAPSSVDVGPADIRVQVFEWSPLTLHARVDAGRPDRLLIHQFFFPGWTATLDGEPIPVRPGGQAGVMTIDVPAGVHDLALSFGWTGVRVVGLVLACGSLAALLAFSLHVGLRMGTRRAVLLAVSAGGLALALALGGSNVARTLRHPSAASEDRWDEIDGQLALVRSAVEPVRVAGGGPLLVELTWLRLVADDVEYDAWIRVAAADGTVHEGRWAYGSVMRAWGRGELVRTTTDVRLPESFPGGPARVSLLLGRRARRNVGALNVIDLGSVDLPPSRERDVRPPFALATEHTVLDTLNLRRYDLRGQSTLQRTLLVPGGLLDVDLDWRVRRPPLVDIVATVELRAGGKTTATASRNVGEWFHPFLGWQTGDDIAQQLRVTIPSDAPAGEHEVWLRVSGRRRAWARLGPRDADSGTPGEGRADIRLGTVVVEPR